MTQKNSIIGGYFAEFPARLRYLMKSRGVKQLDLSAALGLKTRQSITGYLDGSVLPPLDKLIAIADFFNVSVDWLLCRPGATQTTDSDVKSICEYLSLSEAAVNNIKEIPANSKPADSEITAKAALSLLLESDHLQDICRNLAILYNKDNRRTLSQDELVDLCNISAELSECYGLKISVEPREYDRLEDAAQESFYAIMTDIKKARVWSENTIGGRYLG